MKDNWFRTSLMIILTTAVMSCSIKEERRDCPCWLELDISACTQAAELNLSAITEKGILCFTEEMKTAIYPDRFIKEVPKTGLYLSAICHDRPIHFKGRCLFIPVGEDCAAIWASADTVGCSDEGIYRRVTLHKQFAELSIIQVSADGRPSENWSFTIESDVNGFDRFNLSPHEGRFRKDLVFGTDYRTTVRLPRQKQNNGLTILVYEKGLLIDRLPLSRWIDDTGYDWTAEDLEDMAINIDYAHAKIEISINGWDEGEHLEIEI